MALRESVTELVLGAWGGGAFGNDNAECAEWFATAFRNVEASRERIEASIEAFPSGFSLRRVVFAIPDGWKLHDFEQRFIG